MEALDVGADRHASAHCVAGEPKVTQQQQLPAVQTASPTGNRAWIDRHDRLVQQLDQTIEHASLLAPAAVTERYRAKTAAAAAETARMRAPALER